MRQFLFVSKIVQSLTTFCAENTVIVALLSDFGIPSEMVQENSSESSRTCSNEGLLLFCCNNTLAVIQNPQHSEKHSFSKVFWATFFSKKSQNRK